MLLRKGVYPYEYIVSWEGFLDTSLPDKNAFYCRLHMEDISNVDHRHANNVFKKFSLKILSDYHDLYLQSNTIQLCDVFENFRNECLRIYELDPVHFLTAPGLNRPWISMTSLFKKERSRIGIIIQS